MDSILFPSEIEMYVENMEAQSIKNIGSSKWLEWHQKLQKLNQEALLEASSMKEESVKEYLVSFGKIPILTHEAILINLWKHKVLPILLELEDEPESTIMVYSILFHEAVCVALLELVMYHSSCCESLGDAACDLLDYVAGTTSQLLSLKPPQSTSSKKETTIEEIQRQKNDLAFEIGVRSLAIVRYLCDVMDNLPLGVCSGVFTTYDIPVLFAQLLLQAPWKKTGKLYISGQWRDWDNEKLSQSDGQIWLTLRQLLLGPNCSKYYQLTSSRKSQLIKLLPLLQPILLDQLSPLIDLKHWLCRLSMMEPPGSAGPNPILLQPILEITSTILEEVSGKWRKLAKSQLGDVFCTDKKVLQETAKKLSEAYNTELWEHFEEKCDVNVCEHCGKKAFQRCSKCKKAWYCSRECQVNNWKQHRDDCTTNKA